MGLALNKGRKVYGVSIGHVTRARLPFFKKCGHVINVSFLGSSMYPFYIHGI